MCREALEAHLETIPEDLHEAFLESFIRFHVDFEEPAARLAEHSALNLTQAEARLLKALSFPVGRILSQPDVVRAMECAGEGGAVRARVLALRRKIRPLGLVIEVIPGLGTRLLNPRNIAFPWPA